MTRKEALFEIFKKAAEHKGKPFPYNNLEEWEADEPKREAEHKRYWSQKHVWLEDFCAKDRAYYNFIIPESGKEVSVDLQHRIIDSRGMILSEQDPKNESESTHIDCQDSPSGGFG